MCARLIMDKNEESQYSDFYWVYDLWCTHKVTIIRIVSMFGISFILRVDIAWQPMYLKWIISRLSVTHTKKKRFPMQTSVSEQCTP